MSLLKHVLFATCVAMINLGQWQENIYLQMSAIFWVIVLGRWEESK